MRTKDAAKIGTTTYRLWIRRWLPEAETNVDLLHREAHSLEEAKLWLSENAGQRGDAADITRVEWIEDRLHDSELGVILDAEGVEKERWYFYSDGATWAPDGSDRL